MTTTSESSQQIKLGIQRSYRFGRCESKVREILKCLKGAHTVQGWYYKEFIVAYSKQCKNTEITSTCVEWTFISCRYKKWTAFTRTTKTTLPQVYDLKTKPQHSNDKQIKIIQRVKNTITTIACIKYYVHRCTHMFTGISKWSQLWPWKPPQITYICHM